MTDKCNFMAGIVRVELAPAWGIERLRRAGGKVVNIELSEGAGWVQMGSVTAEYSETSENGDAVNRKLKCVLPISEGSNVLEGVKVLEGDRWVVRMTDGRGVQWIIGDEQEPLALTWSRDNEGEASGRDEVAVYLAGEGRWGAMEMG